MIEIKNKSKFLIVTSFILLCIIVGILEQLEITSLLGMGYWTPLLYIAPIFITILIYLIKDSGFTVHLSDVRMFIILGSLTITVLFLIIKLVDSGDSLSWFWTFFPLMVGTLLELILRFINNRINK